MSKGENKTTTHLIAFIDILGFRNLVNDNFSGKNPEALSNLSQALEQAET